MSAASHSASFGLFAGLLLTAGAQWSQAGGKVESKNVTIIRAESSADGSSEMRRELLEDCILSLPNPDSLEPQISSEAVYLREINGEKDRNNWEKSYTAKLEVNYLTSEKELLVITTRSVQEQKPIIKEVDKTLRHSQTFTSDATEGATVAGQSNRQAYFTTADEARKDVRQRARVWIQQQKPVLCRSR